MIKRILVALDQDSDTPVATEYAIRIARQTGAKLTGLAVVDTRGIEDSSRGGGIGSFYYADKLRENLTAETREKARELIDIFERKVEESDVEHVELVEEGVPYARIVEDMKYHDMLIVGIDPHFFYGHPKQHTDTLAGIFNNTIGPCLITTRVYRDVKIALFASDGSNHSARTLRRFIHLSPFGREVKINVLHVHKKDNVDAVLHMEMTKSYLADHGYTSTMISMLDQKPGKCICEQATSINADLIIAGATAHHGILGTKLGNTTRYLIENSPVALFMDY